MVGKGAKEDLGGGVVHVERFEDRGAVVGHLNLATLIHALQDLVLGRMRKGSSDNGGQRRREVRTMPRGPRVDLTRSATAIAPVKAV